MWYLASLSALLCVLAVLSVTGQALIDLCLPWRLRPAAREFLAPVLGLGLLLIPVTPLGWFGRGYRWWICLPLTLALPAAGRWMNRRRGELRRGSGHDFWRLAGFAVLGSFPVLGQLLRYNSFNPFNDTWLYLYQAQWFQQHGFHEPINLAGHHPLAGAILGWRASGLRIAPSFLLGWLQAAFGRDWSYEMYPATISLALLCGALAVGGIMRAAFPGRRPEAWWIALAAAVTLNGFASGTAMGFLPQTLGLAFAAAALALRGLDMAARPGGVLPGRGEQARGALPLSLCVAAVVYCYPELLPFLVPALAASYLLVLPVRSVGARLSSATALCWGIG